MTVLITLTVYGSDTGPLFNLFSDVDNYQVAFEQGVSKNDLVAGYTSTVVPDFATVIRVCSTGVCDNCIDIVLETTTTTSTSTSTTTTTTSTSTSTTTTSTSTSTTTTTTTGVPMYTVNFVIDDSSNATCTPNDTLAGSVTDGTTTVTISGDPQSYTGSFDVTGAFNFDTSLLELHCNGGGIVSPMYIKWAYGPSMGAWTTTNTNAIFNVNPVTDNMWISILVSDADNIPDFTV